MYLVRKRVMVSGENLVDAEPTFQQGEPVVSFRFDTVGGKRFGDATSKNAGHLMAIVLDGKVISAPRIREPILGGTGIITGRFSVAEAQDLALLLRAGALPAPLTILEERSVGPGLGADSIAAGKIASVVGLVLVVVFMILAYGLFGLMADLALVVNMILIAGALSVLQATLTLPGIAGIVLTIGMAVDANVLIFEYIREEIRSGRTPISAVEAGFSRALTTIVDSNLTTLIAAVLLYSFGSGPVRGFAVTLAIGIVTSMFTATMLTRLIVVTWLRRTKPQTLPV
jgi:preprotein translocase subunit SecD